MYLTVRSIVPTLPPPRSLGSLSGSDLPCFSVPRYQPFLCPLITLLNQALFIRQQLNPLPLFLPPKAIILPRVEDEFSISAARVSSLSASIFTGMMLGAIAWGFSADAYGRTIPFKSTLGLTGLFGIASSYSASFEALNVWVFLVGTAVGVSGA
jgi:MFS family permease